MAKATKRCDYVGVTLELTSLETAELFAAIRDGSGRHSGGALTRIYEVLKDIIGGPGLESSVRA